jgi:hypothetical protein
MYFENFNISSNNTIGVEAAKPLQYAIQVPYIKGFGFRMPCTPASEEFLAMGSGFYLSTPKQVVSNWDSIHMERGHKQGWWVELNQDADLAPIAL